MKNAFKNLYNLVITLIFIFSSIICMLETLGANASSVSLSFFDNKENFSNIESATSAALRQSEIADSLFFMDLSIVKVYEDNIYVYDNKDNTIKIIDKKYVELRNFQDVIDKLTTDVVSPIMLASGEIKSFVEQTFSNFSEINNFVKEYDHGAFLALQEKIDDVNKNIDKIWL